MNRLAISAQTSPGSRLEQQRAGLDAVALERGQHDRGGRVRRQAEREHRHQGARGGRVVGRLRAGDALDRALAELLGVLGELALGDVRQERRDLRAAGRDGPEREAERGAAQPRLPRPLPVLPAHPRPTDRDDLDRGWRRRCAATQSASPTAKMPTATTTTSMPSASCGMPKVSRCWPVTESMPTRPMASPMTSEAKPADAWTMPSTAVTAMKASSMIAK